VLQAIQNTGKFRGWLSGPISATGSSGQSHHSGDHRELSMSGRTIACALVALLMLRSVELTAQRRPAERPLRQIEHVMIKADDPREVLASFTETVGLPIVWRRSAAAREPCTHRTGKVARQLDR
jgi:hypothetical protein